uniref:Filamentous hemagglutinin family N-terminal domain-containing protein n=1 Tax=Candidatus Kentrum sp. FW TaxID=2126338 RepID=A0A450SBB2_9GAMM|nr:MAG: filamentous hemagglutinin family N-terminal domain-containing protein [Candidatus Kentron sp. FW]
MKNPASNIHIGTSHDGRRTKIQSHFQLRPLTRAISRVLLPASIIFGAGTVLAAPQNGQIQAGAGSITHGTNTIINQTSKSLVARWDSFNVGADESVRFIQPSASAAVLNRILDKNPSQILGNIDANGRVFLMNPNGVIFGKSARVNVGSLFATGFGISNQDFMDDGRYSFEALVDGKEIKEGGAIINYGTLMAATGGSITLASGAVRNEGVIVANLGQVNLLSGRRATLDFEGDGLLKFAIDGNAKNPGGFADAVANIKTGETITIGDKKVEKGTIIADGGQVLLQGKTASGVFTNVINNTGIIQANGIKNDGGKIRLIGKGGTTVNSGILTATSKNGVGGRIEVLGNEVALASGAKLDASGSTGGGTILVGGDYQGKNSKIHNATNTYVAENVIVRADATDTGNGGTVIVWADDTARVYVDNAKGGKLSARGGPNGGNGGFIEVSGKRLLDFAGLSSVDVSASSGRAGLLLLDPADIVIETGDKGDNGADANDVGATNNITSTTPLYAEDITKFLETGNLEVKNTGGTITVKAGANITIAENRTLTLNASSNLTIGETGNTITTIDGKGGLTGTFGGNLEIINVTIAAKGTNSLTGTGTIAIDKTIAINESTSFKTTNTQSAAGATGAIYVRPGASITIAGSKTLTLDASNGGLMIGKSAGGSQEATIGGTGSLVGKFGSNFMITNAKITATGSNSFTGVSGDNTFDIGKTESGATAVVLKGDLKGGDGNDTFNIGAYLTGNLEGGAGDDKFNINDPVTGDLKGGDGDDTFKMKKLLKGNIVGGGGTDTLINESGNGATFVVTAPDAGTATEIVSGGFTEIENLTGADGGDEDSFTIKSTLSGTVNGRGGSLSDHLIIEVGGSIPKNEQVRPAVDKAAEAAKEAEKKAGEKEAAKKAAAATQKRAAFIEKKADIGGVKNEVTAAIIPVVKSSPPPSFSGGVGVSVASVGLGGVGIGGVGVGGVGAAGVGATGVGGVGATGVGATGVGATGVGGVGIGGVGATGVGATGVGSTGVGATGVGATGVGSTGVGATGVGATGVGSTGVGSTGVGSTGVGSTGVGSTGVGSTGVGATGVGASKAGSASGVGASKTGGASGVGSTSGVGASKVGGTKGIGASKAGGSKSVGADGADKAGTDSGTGASGVDAKDTASTSGEKGSASTEATGVNKQGSDSKGAKDGGKKKGNNKEGSKAVKAE